MSKLIFWIIYILFSLLETYLVLHFVKVKNKFSLMSILIPFLLFTLYLAANYVFNINIPYYALYLIIIALTINSFFGYYLNLFIKSKVFDRYLHAYGSFSYAIFSYSIIRHILHPTVSPRIYEAFFILTLGISSGLLYEIIEFVADKNSPIKSQKSLQDTDFDMIFDTIGAFLAAIVAYFFIL